MNDDHTPDSADDLAFVKRMRERLAEQARDDRDATLDDTFRDVRGVARPRSAPWRYAAIALAAAAVAVVVTWLALRPSAEGPAAFDGGSGPMPRADQAVRLDARGRLAESEIDGERLIFRGGRLIRIEHRKDGVLDGEVVDLDGAGRVVRIETWSQGKLTGTREPP